MALRIAQILNMLQDQKGMPGGMPGGRPGGMPGQRPGSDLPLTPPKNLRDSIVGGQPTDILPGQGQSPGQGRGLPGISIPGMGGGQGDPNARQAVGRDYSDEELDEFKEGKGWSGFGSGREPRRGKPAYQGTVSFEPEGTSITYSIAVKTNGKFEYDGKEFDTLGEAQGYVQRMVTERGY